MVISICSKEPPPKWPRESRAELSSDLTWLCEHLRKHRNQDSNDLDKLKKDEATASKCVGDFPQQFAKIEAFRGWVEDLLGQLSQEDRIHNYRAELKTLEDFRRRIVDLASASDVLFNSLKSSCEDIRKRRERQETVIGDIEASLDLVRTVVAYIDETAPCTSWGGTTSGNAKK